MKTIIKSSKSSCKTRTIATDVVSNYKTKLTELELKVKKIVDLENEEAAFAAAENQINRAQNKLNKTEDPKRSWYQTHYERELEKADKLLDGFSGIKNRNSKGKKLAKFDDTPEGRAKREMEKAAAFRAREVKRTKKGNRVRAGKLRNDKINLNK